MLSLAAQMRPPFSYTASCLSYHSHPIRPCGAPFPRGEGCDTRIPSSKQAAKPPLRIYPLPKYRHPERSRGIFIALPPYAHMRPHSSDTLVLPFSPFPRSRFTALQKRSLPFGRDDVQERRITSHSLSHRYVDPSCAFGAALLQGPTRIVYNTASSKTCNVSPR